MIRYIGSKNNYSNWIIENSPINPEYWVEPFGGMFGVYFNLNLNNYPNTKFIYNEINPHHINLFRYLKEKDFREKLKKERLDESSYLKSFSLYEKGGSEGAIAWLRILNGSRDIRNVLNIDYGDGWSWWKFINDLDDLEEHFNRMEIEFSSYDECIQKWDTPNTFFYLDPPYFGYEHYYTHHNFIENDHEKLKNLLIKSKSQWLLSYYDFPQLNDWYNQYQILKKKFNLGTEILIKK